MEIRILTLPDSLKYSGENFLFKYSVALLYDIEATKSRYNKLISN